MGWVSLIGVANALAMDAFAVAVVVGMALNPLTKRHLFRLSFHFGFFQGLMPVLGWLAGSAIRSHIESVDHWIAFGLLAFVGIRMIAGAASGPKVRNNCIDPTRGWNLVLLSVATSIDALAVGLSLAMLNLEILKPALVIGIVATGFTILGMKLGRRVGTAWGKRIELVGGLILIAIGIKIVLEHTILR